MLHLPGGAFPHQQTATVLQVLLIEAREAASVQLSLIIRTFHRWLTMLRTNFFTRYFTTLVVFYQCFCLSVVTNLLILFVHVGTTGCYHNESLDSLTIILSYGSFKKLLLALIHYIFNITHYCSIMRLVMCIKRICYVYVMQRNRATHHIVTAHRCGQQTSVAGIVITRCRIYGLSGAIFTNVNQLL